MEDGIELEIRIAAWSRGQSARLSIAELGVFLTGINRAINKVAIGHVPGYRYVPMAREPLLISTEISEIRNGSVILHVVSAVSDFADKNILQPGFIASMLAGGAIELLKLLGKEVKRAANRIGRRARVVPERREPYLEPEGYDAPEAVTEGQRDEDRHLPSRTITVEVRSKANLNIQVAVVVDSLGSGDGNGEPQRHR